MADAQTLVEFLKECAADSSLYPKECGGYERRLTAQDVYGWLNGNPHRADFHLDGNMDAGLGVARLMVALMYNHTVDQRSAKVPVVMAAPVTKPEKVRSSWAREPRTPVCASIRQDLLARFPANVSKGAVIEQALEMWLSAQKDS
jgi:hypothetical protein